MELGGHALAQYDVKVRHVRTLPFGRARQVANLPHDFDPGVWPGRGRKFVAPIACAT